MISDKILNGMYKKNVLITGGCGLIGREIVNILTDAGSNVRVVSLDNIKLNKKVEYIFGDLTDYNLCKQITKNTDHVYHIAGIKGSIDVTIKYPASFFVPLIMMNTNLLEACRINKVEKIVYTSSIGAYSSAEIFKENENTEGTPMDHFPGWAKRMAEMQIKAYKLQYNLQNFSIVRPCNVYGPGDNFDPKNAMVIPSLMHRIYNKENPLKVWGDGSAIRDFAFSRDVAKGIILALYHGTKGKFVNLGSGKGCSIKELLDTLKQFIDFNYFFDATKSSGFHKRVMDIRLAKNILGYNPSTSLLEGLQETWNWFKINNREYLNKKNYFN